ncbi:MAG TPA: TIR domain-containing protein [Vitreimonas sp.]|uniref:TIR domain-containing protein n=1 Tax=Vitreimonas sp. TaxID=3069702 RepID=UPI002D43BDC8|nr:TIR domain-containing protein [Vitreimonas sp.]HYD86669.1 TIR domain-containing protein [Vitreimonas sp.]
MRRFFYAAYAPEDAAKIASLVEAARSAGHLIWTERIDADRAPMDLGAVLRAARAVIVFCSAEAFASRAIYKDLVLSVRGGKAILPVYLDDQLPPDQYLFYLARHQGLRAQEQGAPERFLGALEALERGRRRWRAQETAAEPSLAAAAPPAEAPKAEPVIA